MLLDQGSHRIDTSTLFEQFGKWMADQLATIGTPPRSGPAGTFASQSSIWYAGMVVDPTDFSQQLCRLQVSLKGERPDPVEAGQLSHSETAN